MSKFKGAKEEKDIFQGGSQDSKKISYHLVFNIFAVFFLYV